MLLDLPPSCGCAGTLAADIFFGKSQWVPNALNMFSTLLFVGFVNVKVISNLTTGKAAKCVITWLQSRCTITEPVS